jgi:ribose 5-phosphate isomerase B
MRIYLGSDHRGHDLKDQMIKYLNDRGHETVDVGDVKKDPEDDFPVFASRVVHALFADDEFDHTKTVDVRGILICGSGQGMMIAANRFNGIRAGLVYNVQSAKSIRHDEDSNIAAFPADIFDEDEQWKKLIDNWLQEPFGGAARFVRRNKQLDELQ